MNYQEVFNNAWSRGYKIGFYSRFIPSFIVTSMIGGFIIGCTILKKR